MELTQLSDEDLVELVKARGAKDDRPFSQLYHRHQRTVWGLCYRFMGNAHDAEDLTQEVFIKVYKGLPDFEGRSSFKTWLHRIAVNTCQNELRSRKRRPSMVEIPMETLEEVLPDERLTTPLDKTASLGHLQVTLGNMRTEDIELLTLRDVEGRPYAEIANLLGISLSAAKMRVQRARLAMQAAYNRAEQDVDVP